MAWQTPKTDWAAADGVRNTDFNRIEGNILELYNGVARTNLTVYVATTGSDTNGAGTSALPYATITKALNSIPKNLDGRTVVINIAAGTYAETVSVNGFYGGMLRFSGSGTVTINNLDVRACTLYVDNIVLACTAGTGIIVTDNATLIVTSSVTLTSSTLGLLVTNCSSVHIGGSLSLTGMATGIAASNNARIFVSTISGSGIGTVMTASSGATIAYGGNSATANTAIAATSTGGRINTGSQAGTGGGTL